LRGHYYIIMTTQDIASPPIELFFFLIVLSEVKQHLAWSLFRWVAAEVRTLSLLDRKYVMINNSGLDAVPLFIIILFSPSK
jgi:hypothetical protein